ncbi:MAG: LysM peptidoglycan-binding domain-containing protein [Oscillospiraceae bacterium]|nr:LysM peptidoglycan-binding domain-containing protein [Oscillospiraceae bacterium]
MANNLLTDSISTTSRFLDTSFELAVEQEILLADYDKSVFKIVKTCVDHTITQKYINGTKFICEGYFRITVFYQPPHGEKLTVVTKKQPFRHQIDLQTAVMPPYFIPLSGELQYVNTRAVNPTRISVSGVYSFVIKGYHTQPLPVVTAVSSPSVCCDSTAISGFALSSSGIRQFSMEDELSLPEELDKILTITPENNNFTITNYQDKTNIKGDVTVDIAYTLESSAEVKYLSKVFSYNQVVDLPGLAENHATYADFSVVSFTVTANPDTGKVNCILMANLDVKSFRKENVITVLDCFSKSFDYTKSRDSIIYDSNINEISKTFNFQVEDLIGTGYTPVYSMTNISMPEISIADGKNLLKAKRTVTAIVKNEDNEYECFSKTGDISFDIVVQAEAADDVVVKCIPYKTDITISGESMKARFFVDVKGFVIKHCKIQLLSEFEENMLSPLSNPSDALILYYGEKGENVFDIAMKYKTDMATVMTENNLDNKILAEDRTLLIPAYRQ